MKERTNKQTNGGMNERRTNKLMNEVLGPSTSMVILVKMGYCYQKLQIKIHVTYT